MKLHKKLLIQYRVIALTIYQKDIMNRIEKTEQSMKEKQRRNKSLKHNFSQNVVEHPSSYLINYLLKLKHIHLYHWQEFHQL